MRNRTLLPMILYFSAFSFNHTFLLILCLLCYLSVPPPSFTTIDTHFFSLTLFSILPFVYFLLLLLCTLKYFYSYGFSLYFFPLKWYRILFVQRWKCIMVSFNSCWRHIYIYHLGTFSFMQQFYYRKSARYWVCMPFSGMYCILSSLPWWNLWS